MTHLYMNSPKRVTPALLPQQNVSLDFRVLSGSSIASDPNLSSLPQLITYDIFEKQTPQQLLYESAQERLNPEEKWRKFTKEFKDHVHHKRYTKHLVKNLDDTKQWAALHYAVFNNNTCVCNKLAGEKPRDKRFRCDINILTGNGENVLHIAARSSYLWQPSSSPSKSITRIVEINEYAMRLPPIIDKLIERGVDVNHADDEGRTPLHLAVMHNRLPLVKCLLKHKVNIYAKTKLYLNVLHFTFIPNGQTGSQLFDMYRCIKAALKSFAEEHHFSRSNEPPNLALMRTLDNQTPLVFAICHREITTAIIQELLNDMRNNSVDIFNPSPEPNVYQTQIFIAIGQVARAPIRSYDYLKPVLDVCSAATFNQLFHFPCRYNNVNLLQWLIEQSSKYNNEATRQTQTSKNLNLNTEDHAGYTPLMTAIFYSSTECLEYLLQHSNISTRTNTTAFPLAVKIDQTNVAGENILHICAKHLKSQHLLDRIWDSAVKFELPQRPDNTGNLPLHVAAGNNQKDMCEKFLTAFKWSTKPLCMKNNQGQTAAHVATVAKPKSIGPERHFVEKHGKDKTQNHKTSKEKEDGDDDEHDFGLPILKLLWKRTSSDVSRSGLLERDDDGKTCLHLAAENGHYEIVKFLIGEVHLEIDAIADRRLTPLHLACKNGHEEIIAYLIEHGASPTLRNAELYNSLEIAIVNQNKSVVEELLTLPNWRELMRNAQPIHNSEAYDTPMRKLIRYLPETAVWMIEKNLTRALGGQGKHVFKTVYDYEFYMDVYQVKQWHRQDVQVHDEKESFRERCHRRGCTAICCYHCCCELNRNEETNGQIPYTDDAYTLIRNHPLIIASEQSRCPALVEHRYNTFLRDQWYGQNRGFFYIVRAISFILYAAFLAIWTAIILFGKHPQYFYAKVGRNMTLDLDSCANVSRTLTAANDPEALKTTTYKNLKSGLYAFLLLFLIENIILIIALFPRIFRTLDYILEISAFVLTFVYIYDWTDWQNPVVFRCPVQYQIGSMGLLLAWLSMLTYLKRSTWFDMGVFVVMIQLIGFKFIRFIPVLLVVVCGFGFTYWMLLQYEDAFQNPVEAVIRTALLTFELNYEEHLYNNPVYYEIIYFITILTAIVFCIFILNLLISVAVGEIPSLTDRGKVWQSQMLYDLLSDYSIVSMQIIRFITFMFYGCLGYQLFRTRLQPIVIREKNRKGNLLGRTWKYVQMNFFDEKIQDDIKPIHTSDDIKNYKK